MERGAAASSSINHTALSSDDDSNAEQRLATLLARNEDVARRKALYRTDQEYLRAALMTRPVSSQKVFSYFGFMIGSLPPLSAVVKMLSLSPASAPHELSLLATLLMFASVTTGIVGYASGRHIPKLINSVSTFRAPNNVFAIAVIGFFWGALSGAAGGVFLFVVGAIFAGIVGGMVGAATLPILAVLHSLLRSGDAIEMKHFLPVALGITLSLCALILGL